MAPVYTTKLSFIIRKTDINAQKIDGLLLVTYKMIIAGFILQNKLKKA